MALLNGLRKCGIYLVNVHVSWQIKCNVCGDLPSQIEYPDCEKLSQGKTVKCREDYCFAIQLLCTRRMYYNRNKVRLCKCSHMHVYSVLKMYRFAGENGMCNPKPLYTIRHRICL